MRKNVLRTAGVAGAVLASLSVPAQGGGQSLSMLDQIASGRWEVRVREAGNQMQAMCVSNGRSFIQLRHQADSCDHLIVEDSLNEVTVQYTCRGRGYGRTHIRRESNRLVQIDSQGIARGLPFQFTAEARRVGDCSN